MERQGRRGRAWTGYGLEAQAWLLFRLATVDVLPAGPPTFATAVPNWSPDDVISLGRRQLRAIGKRDDDDQPPVVIVHEE